MLLLTKNTLRIILICVLFLIAAGMPGMITVGIMGIMLLIFVYMNIAKYKNTLLLPKLVIVLLLFQNTLIGLGSHYGFSDLECIDYLTQIPTMCIFVTGGCALLQKKKSKADFFGIVLIVLVICYWFVGNGDFISKIIYARNFTCFYMAYLIGKHYIITKSEVGEMIQFFIKLSLIAAVFGMISMLLGSSFYMATGLKEIYIAKKYTAFYSNGMPGNYITKVFGMIVYRMGSFYYEPVNFSYFVALGSIFSFNDMLEKKNLKNTLSFIIIFIGTLLTFGKSGIVIACIGIFIVANRKIINKIHSLLGKRYARKIILFSIVMIGFICMWGFYEYAIHGFGSYAHYAGMINGVKYIRQKPFGYGLGTFGNIAAGMGGESTGVGETGLLTMGCQLGVLGMILFIATLFAFSREINNFNNGKEERNYHMLFTYMPIVLLLFSILQENTITPQCITMYMIFSGAFAKELKGNRNAKQAG